MSVHDIRYQRFIELLRQSRRELGISQEVAAKRLRKPQTYISKCELGERRIDLAEALDFAKLYKKKLSYFVRKMTSRQ